PDVPGDRRVPAERGGGGLMSETNGPEQGQAKSGQQMKATERIQMAGGPGRGPGGMVGQKASSFGPSAKRLVRRLTPQRVRLFGLLALAVVSVLLNSLAPRYL